MTNTGLSGSLFRIFSLVAVMLMTTTINIRVRARTIEEPQSCTQFKKDQPCAIHSQELFESLSLSSAVVKISKGSTIARVSENEVKVVRGLVKVSATNKTIVQTLYGRLEFSAGEVLVEAQDAIIKFTNLSADLKYVPHGEDARHDLPTGFSNYFAAITRSGVAEAGYPKPAEIDPLIKNWSQFYSLKDKSIFKNDLKNFMSAWSGASSLVGPWYVEVVQREIASQEAEEARQARLKAEREAENNKYRDMFRRRIFNDW